MQSIPRPTRGTQPAPRGGSRCGTANRPQHGRGLTLIEVMIGLVMLGVLMTQALPGMASWAARYRLSSQAGTLAAALVFAKNESITRGARVVVCSAAAPSAQPAACSAAAGWADGWLLFVDNVQRAGNQPGVVDQDDTVLRIGEPLSGAVVSADAALGHWLAFSPDGLAVGSGGGSFGTLSICQLHRSRILTVSAVGLVSATDGSC
jgi:type IV fimbrial biogenesis protein FimT